MRQDVARAGNELHRRKQQRKSTEKEKRRSWKSLEQKWVVKKLHQKN